jgi:hypothetical protein
MGRGLLPYLVFAISEISQIQLKSSKLRSCFLSIRLLRLPILRWTSMVDQLIKILGMLSYWFGNIKMSKISLLKMSLRKYLMKTKTLLTLQYFPSSRSLPRSTSWRTSLSTGMMWSLTKECQTIRSRWDSGSTKAGLLRVLLALSLK